MTAVMGVEQQRARYQQAREALWGKPRVVNLHSEIQHRIEQQRKEAKRKWEREQEEKKRQAEAAKRKRENVSEFELGFQVKAAFDVYDNQDIWLPVDVFVGRPTMDQIASNILQRYPGVTLETIRAPGRSKDLVAIRKNVVEAIHRIRPDKKFTEIGRFMHRNHTTILWMLDRLEYKRKRRQR